MKSVLQLLIKILNFLLIKTLAFKLEKKFILENKIKKVDVNSTLITTLDCWLIEMNLDNSNWE